MANPDGGGPIVVGVDGSRAALRAVCWAAAVARSRHVPLRVVHAVEPPPGASTSGYVDTAPLIVHRHDEGRRIVREAAATAVGVETTTSVAAATPAGALLAESRAARLLVLGGTGQSAFPGLLLGSVPARLAAHACCPVAVVRGEEHSGASPVVAGIDGGPLSAAVIEAAFEEAAERGVPLVAVHSCCDGDLESACMQARPYLGWELVADAERRMLAGNLASWQEKYPDVPVERVAVRDQPRHLLLEWSRKAQLVVVGHRGRGGFAGLLLGSTGQALISHARSAVLVVR